ncbi:UvrD-helicase domain-containing protein [Bdellovibrio sp. BCCA]|uniref:UvrD-helicase domain-containing protein n=1 Tax=Bdellovibrio sp. BCCA TaxID=3136281 RepID=UPI0030F26884
MSFFDEVVPEIKVSAVPGKIVFSPEQEAIFSAISKTSRSLIVIAKAGSGKTFTILESAKRVPAGQKIAFMAFNKDIADELKRRIPRDVATAVTINSLGNSSIRKAMPKAEFDELKLFKLYSKVERLLGLSKDFSKNNKRTILNLVKIGKTNGITPNLKLIKKKFLEDTPQNWKKFFFEYSLKCENGDLDKIVEVASVITKESLKIAQNMTYDYTDQIVMPVLYGWECPKFDIIYLDETQDISDIKLELVLSARHEKSRIIAVGDPNQSIYGFAGARRSILDKIKTQFNCLEFTLTRTFRCAKSIVLEANRVVPDIKALDTAPDGLVKVIPDADPEKHVLVNDMVVCRTNAPLMTLAIRLFTMGTPFSFRGNEEFIQKAQEILKGARGMSGSQVAEACKETIKALKESLNEGVNVSGDLDVANFIKSIGEANPTLSETQLIRKITEVFSSSKAGGSAVQLYTIHKAKGLEADRVFFLNAHEIPHERAKSEWELEQEENMRYVAITRAKRELYYIKIDSE